MKTLLFYVVGMALILGAAECIVRLVQASL